jgi:hypothetical protein
MVGCNVFSTFLGGEKALKVDAMAGVYYVKTETDLSLFSPTLGNRSIDKNIQFTDPMVGARAYLALTKKFGVSFFEEVGQGRMRPFSKPPMPSVDAHAWLSASSRRQQESCN